MEITLASLGLFICLLLLVRMTLRPGQRERLDRAGRALRDGCLAFYARRVRALRRPAASPLKPDPKAARQIAQDAIRRARSGAGAPKGEWQGNVFRPHGGDWSGPPDGDKPDTRTDPTRH